MNIIVRTEANAQIGTGHVMRCLNLAQAWQGVLGKVSFVTTTNSPALKAKLLSETMEVTYLSTGVGSEDDAAKTVDLARQITATWVVLDGYQFGTDYQRVIKDYGFKLLVMDDYAHLRHYYADLILNQNYGAEKFVYSMESYTKLLLGTRYVMLRQEFYEYIDYKREIPVVARKLLITFGGADQENHTLNVLRAINLIDTILEVKVVIGACNIHYKSIEEEKRMCRHNIEILKNVEDMASLMAWADVAVSAGGSTIWELAFMGLPSLLCIVAENHENVVKTLCDRSISISLSRLKDRSAKDISNSVANLIYDRLSRNKLHEECRKMVDGNGTERVINEMVTFPLNILFLGGNMGRNLSEWLKGRGEYVLYTDERIDRAFVIKNNPDIIISYNYRYILGDDILDISRLGIINLHISYLPWNRGANPNIWSFLESTPKGITIHSIDKDIDTGDILLQKEIFINENIETLRTSYERMHREIQDLFKTNWWKLRVGKVVPKKQTSGGTLHYKKDNSLFESLLKEKGWDTPVNELKNRSNVVNPQYS
jgi:UDP-2,4-diacetamido-2,4,6-trideoxy-beta-L-altropyranose hydrolase